MVRILADIHTAEAIIEYQVVFPDTALMVFNQEQTEIFKRYGVTEEQFDETYSYYLRNLKAMDALYETIVDTLSLRESKADSLKPAPPEEETPLIFKNQQ
ncbi:hypothetical protein GCM10007389_10120 [Pontibacter akesuensis]|nr:hypothetical protein GCM10007389_10120 [Pontibacter akesuensis]